MSHHDVRFIHASDFHLEQPITGLSHIPARLQDDLIDAPYHAAEQVFEAAIVEDVDFVLLAGDIVDFSQASPRALEFLRRQFESLNEREIAVYWAGGHAEANGRWPDGVGLPDGVQRFFSTQSQEVSHFRNADPVATIFATGWKGKSDEQVSSLYGVDENTVNIAVAYGNADAQLLKYEGIDYWALGSEHQHTQVRPSPGAAYFSGSPLGRDPSATQPHGCLLVECSRHGQADVQFIETDVVRWRTERVSVRDDQSAKKMTETLRERMHKVAAEDSGRTWLIQFIVDGSERIARNLQRPATCDEMLKSLQQNSDSASLPIWPVRVDAVVPREVAPQRVKEDTILGDFLKAARDWDTRGTKTASLTGLTLGENEGSTVAELMQGNDLEANNEITRRAALLGLDLLSGEDAA